MQGRLITQLSPGHVLEAGAAAPALAFPFGLNGGFLSPGTSVDGVVAPPEAARLRESSTVRMSRRNPAAAATSPGVLSPLCRPPVPIGSGRPVAGVQPS
eukprot:5179094-Amphidinium_carterae.2